MSALAVGMRLSSYELIDQIGATRMSEVWRARDGMGRIVALKTISSQAGDDSQLRARFLREGGEHKQLKHPNIVPIFDFFEQDGGFYLVMQYIPGGSLEDKMYEHQWGPIPVRDALRISRQILPALDYAHQHGIIHRDVKPSNILLEGDRAYLADFGIALAVGRPRLTSVTQMVGTFPYMSPEQIQQPLTITHLTDVYSYGCVLYQMLTGRRPHDWDSDEPEHIVLARRVRDTPVPPRQYNPEVPSRLERIVMTALATNPKDRFSGCGTFAKAIEVSETDSNSGFIASLPGAGGMQPKGVAAGFVGGNAISSADLVWPAAVKSPKTISVSGNVIASICAGWFWLTFLGENYQTVGTVFFLCVLLTNILFLRILYKAWAALPASVARTSPGNAIGYLFIPFYNLYWWWNVVFGFANDYNRDVRQRCPQEKLQPEGFYALFAILPYVSWVAWLLPSKALFVEVFRFQVMIMFPIMTGFLATAINRLVRATKQ